MSYITFSHIFKSFEDKEVLKDINISIERREFITLLGPSGCGKTTLLRIFAGLEKADSGKIIIDGKDVTFTESKDRGISMIFQQYGLFPTMTVYNNIAFGLKMKKIAPDEIRSRVKNALNMVELDGSENKFPSQLSGGEKQRVALARAIVTQADILLLDEPFSAIDAKLRRALQLKIKEIHTELRMTTILVTHDQDEAMRMSDRIYMMHAGRVEQSGKPMDLYLAPQTPFAASFMGHYNLFEEEDVIWAIRPESITLSEEPFEERDCNHIYSKGIIKQIETRGNIIRYRVATNRYQFNVDVLYNENCNLLLQRDKHVYIQFALHDILKWSKNA